MSKWYSKAVGAEGLFYHKNLILPKSLELLNLKKGDSLIDLGCGQGILNRYIPKGIYYQGIDISKSLVQEARKMIRNKNSRFDTGDITKELKIKKNDFTHAAIILTLQNVENYQKVFDNAFKHLKTNGKLLIVINHPYFRIPRQTSWQIDHQKKLQYRRVDRYLTPLKIPINMNPGQPNTKITWSFHYPLQDYVNGLSKVGFLIEKIEEWVSPKISVGKASKMENRARSEFPLFMAILAIKY